MDMFENNFPRIIAHRGASGYAPENTLAAMEKAKQLGIHWVEFDVQMLRDGEIIVLHDDRLERTSNGHGPIGNYPFAHIQQLDAGSWFDINFAQEKIPSLQQMLRGLQALELSFVIELKSNGYNKVDFVQNVLESINAHWHHVISPIYFSEDPELLGLIRTFGEHNALIGLVMDQWQPEAISLAKQEQIALFALDYRQFTDKIMETIAASDVKLICYTVNDKNTMEDLWQRGVHGIISDYPDLGQSYE